MTEVVKIFSKCTTQRQANFLFLFSPLTIVQIEAPSYKGEMYSLFGSTHAVKNDFILPTGGNCFSLLLLKQIAPVTVAVSDMEQKWNHNLWYKPLLLFFQ